MISVQTSLARLTAVDELILVIWTTPEQALNFLEAASKSVVDSSWSASGLVLLAVNCRLFPLRAFREQPLFSRDGEALMNQRAFDETLHLSPDAVSDEMLARVGLARDEYDRAREMMGRDLTIVELGIFGAMWSEHCCYKSSRLHLKKLPTKGAQVLQGPGENAGIVDLGEGTAVAFKIESHNHPSAVEPFQGAATGIGGIIRDVFAMGARPIALMDPLRFGPITPLTAHDEAEFDDIDDEEKTRARTRYLVSGVVSGIAHYGNCIGVPTVGGEIMFDDSYSTNPIVNVLCLGTVNPDEIVRGIARGSGNPVLYVGAKTGRDGIQGATFASVNLAEDASIDRPAVQVGDPFYEKLLLEACLEIAKMDGLIGMQDMGAAGLTSSTCEMAARGGVGIEMDLDKVPQRADDLTAYEMMLSESQERMVLTVERGRESEFIEAFKKWDLDAVEVGVVIDDPVMRIKHKGVVVAEIPNNLITEDAPEYDRPTKVPEYISAIAELHPEDVVRAATRVLEERPFHADTFPSQPNQPCADLLLRLLAHPNISSKRIVFEQYDHMVRTGTIPPYDGDAAVVRIKGKKHALAISTDCPSKVCYLDPEVGAMWAVCEAARNLIAVGARPLAITNCLNFGNPEDPEVMWQFVKSIDGMSKALGALDTPVTGGNVSFYNETMRFAVNPTPVIGMVGVLPDAEKRVSQSFRASGNRIFIVGDTDYSLAGSTLACYVLQHEAGCGHPSRPDLEMLVLCRDFLLKTMADGMIESCHDIGDGGLAVTAAEMSFGTGFGCEMEVSGMMENVESVSGTELRAEHLMSVFSEAGNRWLVEIAPENAEKFASQARKAGIEVCDAGKVGGDMLGFTFNGRELCSIPLDAAEKVWRNALETYLENA